MSDAPLWLQVVFGLFVFFVLIPLGISGLGLVIVVVMKAFDRAAELSKSLLRPLAYFAIGTLVLLLLYLTMALSAWIAAFLTFSISAKFPMDEKTVDALYSALSSILATALALCFVLLFEFVGTKSGSKHLPFVQQFFGWTSRLNRAISALILLILFWLSFHFRSGSSFYPA